MRGLWPASKVSYFGIMDTDTMTARIAELETELQRRDDQLKEVRSELAEAREMVDQMREQVDDVNSLTDSWIEAFELVQGDDGKYYAGDGWDRIVKAHTALREEHMKLLRQWNRFVPEYNATVRPRDRGRPLAASEHQVRTVRKLAKAGNSQRSIATETGLGVRTVRTILERDAGTDRTAKRTNLLRKREVDRQRQADWRARKRVIDDLPARATRIRQRGDELVKAAKGLGEQ